VEAFAGPAQDGEERKAVVVGVAEKDRAPLVTAGRDVIQRSGKFKSSGSGHGPVALC
jgi:hypothetical protein